MTTTITGGGFSTSHFPQPLLTSASAPSIHTDFQNNAFLASLLEDTTHEQWETNKVSSEPVFEYKNDRLMLQRSWTSTVASAHIGSLIISPPEDLQAPCKKRVEIKNWLKDHPKYCGKRVSINANGNLIDVFLLGKRENFFSGRWMLFTHGRRDFAEQAFLDNCHNGRVDALNTNLVFFNYPGVACSKGDYHRNELMASFLGALQFIEEKIQAKEIICFGVSLGGFIQGHAFNYQQPKKDITRVSVKFQTGKKMTDVGAQEKFTGKISEYLKYIFSRPIVGWAASYILPKDVGAGIKYYKWELNTVKSSQNLKFAEIIIQNAKILEPKVREDIVDDGCFTQETSLATPLLEQQLPNKTFIGIKSIHGAYNLLTPEEAGTINQAILNALSSN